MALLNESFEDKKFDTRVIEKNTERGLVSAKDVAQYLKELPDDAENAEYVPIADLTGDPDDSDDSYDDEDDQDLDQEQSSGDSEEASANGHAH